MGTNYFFDNWPKERRIEVARATIEKVVDHLLYVLQLQANSEWVVYSGRVAKQIPTSFAAHAYNTLRECMHQYDVIRICALWDEPSENTESIPTVAELIADDEIIAKLADDARKPWHGQDSDSEISRIIDEGAGAEAAARAREQLPAMIEEVRDLRASPRLEALRQTRNKYLAHNLSVTWRELRDPSPIRPLQYTDEQFYALKSVPIVEKLQNGISGKGFQFGNSVDFNRRNAQSLWSGCTFEIED